VPVGIAHVDRAEGAAVEDVGALDPVLAQVVAPGLLLLRRVDGQREVVRGAGADHALGQLGVLHEADQHAGAALERAEPHVAGLRIVVGRAVVDDRHPEQVAVERDRPVEVGRDGGEVVKPPQLHALLLGHGPAEY
jgi:hypothetical protein